MSGSGSKKEMAKAFLKQAWTATRAAALNMTKIEVFTEDALDDKPWGPHGQQLQGE